MREPPTNFKGLEKAYKNRVEQVYHPERYRKAQLSKERKANGVCIMCGIKRITKNQKERGLVSCFKCRKEQRE